MIPVRALAAVIAITLSFPAPAISTPVKPRKMAPLTGVTSWLNTATPPTPEGIRGKVVLVDFWTYSCVNCIRSFPQLKRWHEQYADKGLVIIGVHSPEFAFETIPENVARAIKRWAIPYPVAMDDGLAVWKAFGVNAWPTHFLVDRQGMVRDVQRGEGSYQQTEELIQTLLSEGGPAIKAPIVALPAGVDFSVIRTPEIYFGYQRLSAIGNRERVIPDRPVRFSGNSTPKKNFFLLHGEWRVEKQRATLVSDEGRVAIRFEANRANMVLHAPAGAVVDVWIDGKPATAENKGDDVTVVDGRAIAKIDSPRLYNFVNTVPGEHLLELRIKGAGLDAYTFTFG